MTPHHLAVLAIIITVSHGAVRNQPQTTTTRPPPKVVVMTTRESLVVTRTTTPEPPPPPAPTPCSDGVNPTSPLARLRSAMKERTKLFDGFLVFYSDEHLSEEPSAEERRLEYISGWDGAGMAAVLASGEAAVWVHSADVRRANDTLSCAWTVWDVDEPSQPTVADWVAMNLRRNGRVGCDMRLISWNDWQTISAALQGAGMQLHSDSQLLDQLWAEEPNIGRRRPDFSKIVANDHHKKYIGMTWREKVSLLRKDLQSLTVDAMVVTALDEVAWLLNIRGRDLPYAPLLKAFVFVTMKDIRVYAPAGKLSMPLRDNLAVYNCYSNNCTKVEDYTKIHVDLRVSTASKILIPAGGTFQRGASAAIVQSVPQSKRVILLSPIIYLKAQKNKAEINGMRRAHLRDAVAMCTLFNYLENMVKNGGHTEMSVAMKVDSTRATQAGYVGPAMRTLVGFGPSGAQPGHRAAAWDNGRVFPNSTLVVQSGGQYDEGTTVVTRTLHYGIPTREMRLAYTTVLRSVAALATLQVPATLPAAHADPVARAPLWQAKQDYAHPTGHGVGAALNTREDPVVIDYRQDTNLHTFRDGYFITSEPAWYEHNKFGVKLGNVLEVMIRPEGNLGFSETTLLPYEPKLIDKSLLTEYEIMWLNAYNDRIRKVVGPELKDQGLWDEYYWMSNKTIPIEPPSKVIKKRLTSSVDGHAKMMAIPIAVCTVFVYLL